MGLFFSKESTQLKRVIIVGLDCAGKTTLLYKIAREFHAHVETTIPTIGFNVETVKHRTFTFVVWDVGGKDKIRPLWRQYYEGVTDLVFVVDSNDRDRFLTDRYGGGARDELSKILREDGLREARLLVMANKQDIPGAMTPAEIAEGLGLGSLVDRPWRVQRSVLTTGEGVGEMLGWLKGDTSSIAETGTPPSISSLPPPLSQVPSSSPALPVPCSRLNTMSVLPATTSATATASAAGDPAGYSLNGVGEALARRSFAVLELGVGHRGTVARALAATSTGLSGLRARARAADAARAGASSATEALLHFGLGGVAVSVAHWPCRTQLRLLRALDTPSSLQATATTSAASQKGAPMSTEGQGAVSVACAAELSAASEMAAALQDAWAALAEVGAGVLTTSLPMSNPNRDLTSFLPRDLPGNVADRPPDLVRVVHEHSAFDAFVYPRPEPDTGAAAGEGTQEGGFDRGEARGAGVDGDDSAAPWDVAAHTEASVVTLLVADAEGLECRDASTGLWVAIPPGRCAVLAGRRAGLAGATVGACDHRVRAHRQRHAPRAVLSLDVHLPAPVSSTVT